MRRPAPTSRPARSKYLGRAAATWSRGWQMARDRGLGQVQFWFLALLVGIAAGLASLGFRTGISVIQSTLYGTEDVAHLHSFARGLAWYWIVLIPVLGGLVVGLVLHWFTSDGRARAVSEVIEGAALHDGRVEKRAGLASAFAALITLSSGGSSGREGPVVHLASVISAWISTVIKADGITGRDLLGCAVAAAISASFNTPIAGAIFALEVVLRHFAFHAIAPIFIASVAGTVINRMSFGDVTEFSLGRDGVLAFYVELPAFLILGLVCGLVAVTLMRSIFWAETQGDRLQAAMGLHRALRPALAGGLLGGLAVFFPHIIGVGYETTSLALTGNLLLFQAILFAVVKVAAVAITFGGRMGGGVFSPALMTGALTGLAYGMVATSIFPHVSGSETIYALAGMGAVAAAVLGGPISTTLIVFELTGDWQTGLAVMVAVSMSTAIASRLVDRSFFMTQLERDNIALSKGPQAYLLGMFRVANVMRKPDDPRAAPDDGIWEAIEAGHMIESNATLKTALPMFDETPWPFLPVVKTGAAGEAPEILGALFHVDALRAYNRALAATAAEEHS